MRRRIVLLWLGAVISGVLLCGRTAPAAGKVSSGDELSAMNRQINQIENRLTQGAPGPGQFAAWMSDASGIKAQADRCVSDNSQNADEINRDLAILPRLRPGEVLQLTRQRELLRQERLALGDTLASCQQLSLRAAALIHRIARRQRQVLAAQLFGRGPAFTDLLRDTWGQSGKWIGSTRIFLVRHSGFDQLTPADFWILSILAVAAALIGILLRRRLSRFAVHRRREAGFSGNFGMSMTTAVGRYLPYLLASASVALYLRLSIGEQAPLPLINLAAYGLPAYFMALAIICLFLAPVPPAQPYVQLSPGLARPLAVRLRVLVLLGYVGYLGFGTLVDQDLPTPALLLARGVFFVVLAFNVLWVTWLVTHIGRLSRLWAVRTALVFLLTGAMVAEVLGYRNLSRGLLQAVTGTLLASGLLIVAGRLLGEFFDRLSAGRRPWHQRLHQAMDLAAGQPIPGLFWLRITAFVLLWVVFLFAILRVWGLSDAALLEVGGYVAAGFTVGSMQVFPLRIILALVIFIALYSGIGWVRARLKKRWLGKFQLESGARDTMVTISGYIGTSIAILVALGVAGLSLGNLAIIAGALSVGIGFGLQNIVNNFVSGLILLFERPIKIGDWIVVGSTEGFVRHINIRATQIQTFDRADVIVPNSELISGQVTNLMLRDPGGRVRIPVSVAYGSDTGMVKDLLVRIGAGHPLVIRDNPERPINVYFLAFGDSSLRFELQCHIGNVAQRQQVISDLNFAIDAEFRKHGIEMPFPQRDIHVRGLPPEWTPPAAPRPPQSD
ncbi:MAG: mechanosensitive ion channel family protein [Acidiferrobacterales bacterium]